MRTTVRASAACCQVGLTGLDVLSRISGLVEPHSGKDGFVVSSSGDYVRRNAMKKELKGQMERIMDESSGAYTDVIVQFR
ncbi:MAG: hypothetical protein AAF441_17965, partial [Pseudomonadota bacterium]